MNSDASLFADRLMARLAEPLPGRRAQRTFLPELAYGRHHGPPAHDARAAAVLALLYPVGETWYVPLTLRPSHLSDHAGQVSFPGGMCEPGESAEACAVRELHEELGAPAEPLRVLGRLSSVYVFASNFQVTPVVAITSRRPDFEPNPAEVARLLELPLAALEDQQLRGFHLIERGRLLFRTPHLEFDGARIWGATCLMLGELAALVRTP